MASNPLKPSLESRNVSKEFGYRRVLDQVNLGLCHNTLTLLLGKNGSGKSTLMKIMTGLMRPSSGQVLYQGKDVIEDPSAFRQSFGFITHQSNLYADLTARENLLFAARLRKIKKPSEIIAHVLDQTGLSKFADVRVKIFSSGMLKRLNIARLLMIRPEILLLDEPYTGLDYDSIDFFNRFLNEFKSNGGAVLLISHQIDACFDLTDHVAIIENKTIKNVLPTHTLTREELVSEYHQLTN